MNILTIIKMLFFLSEILSGARTIKNQNIIKIIDFAKEI